MSSENEKKGLLGRLLGTKKPGKSTCCGSFRIEAISDDADEKSDAGEKDKNEKGKSDNCCCQ